MSPRPPRTGFVATGPGFYVWEETRRAAFQAARDLSPPSAGAPRVVPAAQARSKPHRRERAPSDA
jgi:hypothetical protein